MTINWIKCSERMPPDDDSEIFIRKLNCSEWQQTPSNEIWLDIDPDELYQWEWIPYDKETWEMLTDKTRTKNDN